MSATVTIDHVALMLRAGAASHESAEQVSRDIFLEVEQYLDRTIGELDESIFIPRVELECVLSASASGVAGAVAHAIGGAIAAALREARGSSHVPGVMRRADGAFGRTLSGRLGAIDDRISPDGRRAEGSRRGELNAGIRSVAEFEAEMEPDSSTLWQWIERQTDPLEALIRIARQGRLAMLASDLGESTAHALLSRVRSRLRPQERNGVPVSATEVENARFERARARARDVLEQCKNALIPTGALTRSEIELVLTVALLGRLSVGHVARSSSLAHTIDAVLATVVPAAEANPDPGGCCDVPHDEIAASGQQSARRDEVLATPAGFPTTHSSKLRECTELGTTSPGGDVRSAIQASTRVHPSPSEIVAGEMFELLSQVAGLAFLLRPLDDLGFSPALAAIHLEPTIAHHVVLRRILEIAAVDAPDEDPASWLLAGLFDAPDADDRADDAATWTAGACSALARAVGVDASDYIGAIDAWARATLAETRARLEGTGLGDALGAEVIAVRGTLLLDDDRLTVTVPFTNAYEPLLRAGLLGDLPFVPWLGGRALRFVFKEAV